MAISKTECCDVVRIYNCQGEEISPGSEGVPLDDVYLTTEKERSPWIYSLHASQPASQPANTLSSSTKTNREIRESRITKHLDTKQNMSAYLNTYAVCCHL